jgi:hypothetical protein
MSAPQYATAYGESDNEATLVYALATATSRRARARVKSLLTRSLAYLASGVPASGHGAVSVDSITPDNGVAGGGTSVTVTGKNLLGATSVKFGTTAGTSVVINSGTQLHVTSPAHSAGAVGLQVVTPVGSSTLAGAFTFTS